MWLSGFSSRTQPGGPINIFLRDFRYVDLCEADVIFLYLVPEVFASLEQKLEREIKTGTKIISHGFSFPGKEPVHVERCPLRTWQLIASNKKGPRIFVYEW